MSRYRFRTFSALSLLQYEETVSEGGHPSKKVHITLDGITKHPALQQMDLHENCALYDQLKLQLGFPLTEEQKDCLLNVLVYVDFDRVPFLKDGAVVPVDTSDEQETDAQTSDKQEADKQKSDGLQSVDEKQKELAKAGKRLLENGFDITVVSGTGTNATFHYRAFEKSASMARQKMLTFLADCFTMETKDGTKEASDLYQAMYDRLSVGIVPPNNTALSKWYAYRGLYLSTAKRIDTLPIKPAGSDPAPFQINEKTVIVIEDDIYKGIENKENILTAVNECDDLWTLEEQKECLPHFKSFDGEGIISPEWTECVNTALGYPGKAATSFQIRMPFTKGVVHEVDFHRFFKEELLKKTEENAEAVEKTYQSIKITDYFDIERDLATDLATAQMIIPASMFKACHWLKTMQKAQPGIDPMKYFFEQCETYNHALYVGNDNTLYQNSGWIKLNYQFLNPIDLSSDQLKEMVDTHMNHIRKPTVCTAISSHSDQNASTGEDGVETDVRQDSAEDRVERKPAAWQQVLKKHPQFFHDPYIKHQIETTFAYAKRDIVKGRFQVRGECRFLSRDLLAYLLYIADCTDNQTMIDEAKLLGEGDKEKKIASALLFTDRFYMPQANIPLNANKACLFLRNPHLSRNEEVLLKPYTSKNSLHKEYFKHLSGVVMIPLGSWAANALGGADFDGDLVKVVCSEPMVNAVMGSVYKEDVTNNEKGRLVRTMPVIEIPNVPPSMKKPNEDVIDYGTVRDTFSNQVGKISNLAIRWGKLEYGTPEEELRTAAAAASNAQDEYEVFLKSLAETDQTAKEVLDTAGVALSDTKSVKASAAPYIATIGKIMKDAEKASEKEQKAQEKVMAAEKTLAARKTEAAKKKAQTKVDTALQVLTDAKTAATVASTTVKKIVNAAETKEVDLETLVSIAANIDRAILLKKEASVPAAFDAADIKNKTPYCTILVGLDIDAAKTGRHPDISPILREDWKRNKDSYLKRLTEFKQNNSFPVWKVKEPTKKQKKKEYTVSFLGANPIRFTEAEATAPNIDRLPTLFAQNWKKELDVPKNADGNRFPFTQDADWRSKLDETKRQAVHGIISDYHKTLDRYGKEQKQQVVLKNRQYLSFVKYILMLQYGSTQGVYAAEENKVDAIYKTVLKLLPAKKDAQTALRALQKKEWQFTPQVDRKTILQEILPQTKDVTDAEYDAFAQIVTNFSHAGFYLLYYLVKDCTAERTLTTGQPKTIKTRYQDLYTDAETEGMTKSALRESLQASCRRDLVEAFADQTWQTLQEKKTSCKEAVELLEKTVSEGHNEQQTKLDEAKDQYQKVQTELDAYEAQLLQEAIQYAYAEVGKADGFGADPDGRFFWEIFTGEEILQAIEPTPEPVITTETEKQKKKQEVNIDVERTI